jgi:hypothetical protein
MDATVEEIISAIRRASIGEVLIPAKVFARAIARGRSVRVQAVVSVAPKASSNIGSSKRLPA